MGKKRMFMPQFLPESKVYVSLIFTDKIQNALIKRLGPKHFVNIPSVLIY